MSNDARFEFVLIDGGTQPGSAAPAIVPPKDDVTSVLREILDAQRQRTVPATPTQPTEAPDIPQPARQEPPAPMDTGVSETQRQTALDALDALIDEFSPERASPPRPEPQPPRHIEAPEVPEMPQERPESPQAPDVQSPELPEAVAPQVIPLEPVPLPPAPTLLPETDPQGIFTTAEDARERHREARENTVIVETELPGIPQGQIPPPDHLKLPPELIPEAIPVVRPTKVAPDGLPMATEIDIPEPKAIEKPDAGPPPEHKPVDPSTIGRRISELMLSVTHAGHDATLIARGQTQSFSAAIGRVISNVTTAQRASTALAGAGGAAGTLAAAAGPVAAGVGAVAAGVIIPTMLAKSAHEAGMALADRVADVSPEVAMAQADREFREIRERLRINAMLGGDLAQMVEAGTDIREGLNRIGLAFSAPIIKDVADIKAAIGDVVQRLGQAAESVGGVWSEVYPFVVRFLPFLGMIAEAATASRIISWLAGDDEDGFGDVFKQFDFLTPPGWETARETDAPAVLEGGLTL